MRAEDRKELCEETRERALLALARLNAVDPELVEMLLDSTEYLARLRPMSVWSYKAAATAYATEGVFGTLVVRIPGRSAGPDAPDLVDMTFHTGKGRYSTD